MSSVPTGGSTIKNILIGVVTTVIAYSIFYYIHDKKLASEEKHKKESATFDAWNSTLKYENISSNGIYVAYCDDDPQNQLEDIIYEKNQLVKNYEIVKAQQDVDPDMKSFLSSAIGSTNETIKGLENFLTDLKEMKKTNGDVTLASEVFQKMNKEYSERLEKDADRREHDINETYKILNDKFDHKLTAPSDSLHMSEFDIYGKWKEAGIVKIFNFKSNHTVTMTAENQDFPGKWTYASKSLKIVFEDNSELEFHFTKKKDQYFLCTLNKEDNERQFCKL